MPKWNDFGNIWSTLRELDVSAIRAEMEKPLTIACVGHDSAIDAIDTLLHTGDDRYGLQGINPIEHIPFEQAASRIGAVRTASMLIIAVDARASLGATETSVFEQLERVGIPSLLVLVFGTTPQSVASLPRSLAATSIAIPDTAELGAPERLATSVLERLPSELHLAAARRLPGLRTHYTRELINSSSFTNATYAIGTALPEQIPILNVPFALADIVVLTKNQALMVYRMALAYGAKPDFQERLVELAPVVGGGFLWRQIARTLIGLVPIWGIIPKVAIAYGGTYATGVTAWSWFARGDVLTSDQVKKISRDAIALGKQRATEIIARARQIQPRLGRKEPAALPDTQADTPKPGFGQRVRDLLTRRNNKQDTSNSPTES